MSYIGKLRVEYIVMEIEYYLPSSGKTNETKII